MDNKLLKKLRGYYKTHRERFLVLHMGMLTLEEFVVYEFATAITDWDQSESHRETYGTFKATNKQIADILGWKSDSQVSRIRKRLLEKEFIFKDGDRFRVKQKDFEDSIIRKSPIAKTQSESANTQYQPAKAQEELAKMQTLQGRSPDYSLVSSKDNVILSSSNTDINDYRREDNEDVSPEDIPF